MEPFTLNRNFLKENVIDSFKSCIWTERYYGDSEVTLLVPDTPEMSAKLPPGTFVGVDGSDEVMILETRNTEDTGLKLTGISLLKWLNNRFIRTSPNHEDRYWYISGSPPGWILWYIVYSMCVEGSDYLDGTVDIGVSNPERFIIPGLTLKSADQSGSPIDVGVPYGPVYDALRELAITYNIGIQITLESAVEGSYILGFRSYRGIDRTSSQTTYPLVRFSPRMDSLANPKELDSIAALKNLVYAFAPSNPDGLATVPGVSISPGSAPTGFDLRAQLVFADDVTTDMVGGSSDNLVNVLNNRAHLSRIANRYIKAVDGEIVPTEYLKYGVHYNLGDIVEVQGDSGIIQPARVTEYIRTHDATGQKSYPTVEIIS